MDDAGSLAELTALRFRLETAQMVVRFIDGMLDDAERGPTFPRALRDGGSPATGNAAERRPVEGLSADLGRPSRPSA